MLKDDILRLLREDEEFRYAVIGLLGLQRLEEAMARLIDTQANMESRLRNVEEAVAKLSEDILTKLVENVTRLADNIIKLADRVAMLVDTMSSIESRLIKVEEAIIRLADIQVRQEDRLVKVEDRLVRTEEALMELKNIVVKQEERLARVVSVDKLTAIIGTIGRRLSKDMEKMILKIYRDQLIQLGIDPDNAKRFRYIDREGKYGRKGKEYEFDIVISNNHIDVLKAKMYTEKDDVEWFYENVEVIKELFDKPLRRKVIVTVHIDEDALIKTDELGINVIYGNVVKD
jgi:hypothetical protein